jgi:adenylosuccinate synthase
VDYLSKQNRNAFRFDQLQLETVRFIDEVERVSGVPVSLISTNFNWRNIIDRRSW